MTRIGFLLVGIVIGVLVTISINIALINKGSTAIGESEVPDNRQTATNNSDSRITNTEHEERGVQVPTSRETDSPRTWETLVSDDQVDVGQIPELVQVALELHRQHGIAILDRVYDSIDDTVVRDAVASSILHQALENGFRATFDQAKRLDGEVRRWVLHEIVKGWARVDPQATFATVWSLSSTDPSLRMLQRRAVWEWAEGDPKTALTQLDSIPDNVRDFAEEKALLALARLTPTDAIEYLPKLSGSKRESTIAKEIVTSWVKLDPEACIQWLNSIRFSSPELKTDVTKTAFMAYARQAPEHAFQAALKQPTHLIEGGVEANVIAEVAKFDSGRARSMLSHVRDDATTMFNAYLYTGQELVRSHLDFDGAIELGDELPVWKDDYYSRLMMYWTSYHPIDLLVRMENLPSKHRSHAALCLISINKVTLELSSLQIEQAEEYLNENDLKKVRSLPKHYVNSIRVSTGES